MLEPQTPSEPETYEFGPFVLDVPKRLLQRNGERVDIKPKSFDVLVTLLRHYPETVTIATFKDEVWSDAPLTPSTLQQQIWTVRQTLGDEGEIYLKSVTRQGYRFAGPITGKASRFRPLVQFEREQLSIPEPRLNGSDPQQKVEPQNKEFAREPGPAVPAAPVLGDAASRPAELNFTWSRTRRRWALGFSAGVLMIVCAVTLWSKVWRQGALNPTRQRILTLVAAPESPDTDTTIKLIKVGTLPWNVVLRPASNELYVAESGSPVVSVIDLKSERVVCTLHVAIEPSALAASPDGRVVYVAQVGGGIQVIDTVTKRVSPLGSFTEPVVNMAITRNGSWAYLALGQLGVGKLDLGSKLLVIISKQPYAQALALTPDGRRLYVSYQAGGPGGSPGHDAIAYFDTSNDRRIGVLKGFPNVGDCLSAAPDNSQVWESGEDACDSPQYDHTGCPAVPAGLLNIIDNRSSSLNQSVAIKGARLECISFPPNGNLALVATTGQLLFLDRSNLRIVRSVPVHSSGHIAFSKDGDVAYAPLPMRGGVAVIPLKFHVNAFRIEPLGNSDGEVTVGVISTTTFNAQSIDPGTLRLGDERVKKTSKGFLKASFGKVTSFAGIGLVVRFDANSTNRQKILPLDGQTLAGVPIHGEVEMF